MHHNIYFSICGEGYGHSSRDMAIAEELKKAGAKVLLGSYGYVLERLKKSFDSIEMPREFEMAGAGGEFDLKRTISKSALSAFGTSKIIFSEEKIIKSFGATCVVADGRWSAVVAAFRLGLPCIIVANQTTLRPFFKESDFFINLFGKNLELAMGAGAVLSDAIIVPDMPPPKTVCIGTLSKEKRIMKKEIFAGPVVSGSFLRKKKVVGISRPFILTILGGHAFRLPVFDEILKAAEKFPKMTFLIFTKFKSDKCPKNVIVRGFADDISRYMHTAELIITQAGHSTAMELLALGKPALIIPDKGQAEQESNAARMKELGVAETLDYSYLSDIPEKINLLLCNKKYKQNAAKYSKMARKMSGAKKAAQIILEYSERMQNY